MSNFMKVTLVLLSTKAVVGNSADDSAMMIQQAQTPVSGPTNPLTAIMDDLPSIMNAVPTMESLLREHHNLTDALRSAFATPVHNVSSVEELQSLLKVALVQSGALHDAKNIAEKLKIKGGVAVDSVNIGLTRAFAPYPAGLTPDWIDSAPLHFGGGLTFFFNIVTDRQALIDDTTTPVTTASQGDTRLCVALGGAASFCASGEGSAGMKGCFKGTEFGGEDFYFGLAKAKNVPGRSWAMNFNHDYVDSGLKLGHGRLAKQGQDADYYKTIAQWYHPYRMLSQLSGGFELTAPDSQFVAVNFEVCMFGKSQGGACNDQVTRDEAKNRAKEEGSEWANPQTGNKPIFKEKQEYIDQQLADRTKLTQEEIAAGMTQKTLSKEELAQIYKTADLKFKQLENTQNLLWWINRFYGTTFEGGYANTWCAPFGLSDR